MASHTSYGGRSPDLSATRANVSDQCAKSPNNSHETNSSKLEDISEFELDGGTFFNFEKSKLIDWRDDLPGESSIIFRYDDPPSSIKKCASNVHCRAIDCGPGSLSMSAATKYFTID